ncbi:hypothetical protein UAY_01443 [Enterococcus moraviensis ATCC BAA-383]|uniref:Uncharacterized protein n=1 Tax=Enterococcus moraviensis ATCC BAA-383 TaxID=1158609 RepID=R2QV05_9ENTE|nr:hypothetical protein [Enterococcus moraviensis]EOI00340.1 hypothetical protein UAY_01443 [Enterococcus moraviensis ATCC BAA-383]EOT73431.1 hypothetical protein I586_00424 [Enterococcus moraviensis ATCC BAA-383]
MKINLKRQTTWGCVRHFSVYRNGTYQGKLFNNISTELDVNVGDTLEFREGSLRFSQKIKITPETDEITITNTNHIQQLFSLFIILFLAISLISLSIESLSLFLFTEITAFVLLNQLFRYRSYQFSVETHHPIKSFFKDVVAPKIIM